MLNIRFSEGCKLASLQMVEMCLVSALRSQYWAAANGHQHDVSPG